MDVRLRNVPEGEATLLRPLVDAYFAEVSKFRQRPVGPIDAAGYRYLPLYWSEAARYPFFIEADGAIVGFTLVREVSTNPAPFTELAEFFIQPASRRAGLGRRAAAAVWQTFPGQWELQVALGNLRAVAFWRACIEEIAGGDVSREEFSGEDGRRVRYRFTVRPTAQPAVATDGAARRR